MAHVRRALTSSTGRVATAVTLLLGTITVAPMFSGSASAHMAHIDAEVSCDGTIHWSSSSWSKSGSGENEDVRVTERHDGVGDHEIAHGEYSTRNGYEFSGTLAWPKGATHVTLTSWPHSSWGGGDDGDHSDERDEIELSEPKDCEGDSETEHEVVCEDHSPGEGDGDLKITLHNPSGPFGHDIEFDVYSPDSEDEHTTHVVKPGDDEVVEYHGLEDGTHHVKIESDDGEDHDEDVTVDCDQSVPSVTPSQACVAGDGAITVNLSNTGGEAVEFVVENPVTHVAESVHVEAGDSVSRTFAGLADGEYTVPVHVGDTNLSQHFEVHCDGDSEPPHDECPADGHDGHDGDDDGDDESSSSVPHSTEDGEDDESSSSMEQESSSSMEESSTSGPEITAHYRLTGLGGYGGYGSTTSSEYATSTSEHASSSTEHEGSSSSEAESSTSDDEDGPSTSEHATSTTDKGDPGDDDEDDPCHPVKGEGRIEVAKACVDLDGQLTITLFAVGGDEPVEFVVEGVTYEVQPDSSRDVVLSGLTDGVHHISVWVDDHDLSFDTTIGCDLSPKVTVTQACVAFDGQVSFLLENLGDDRDATFTVDGIDHVLAPGASDTVVFDGLADGPVTFTLSINGIAMPDVQLVVECNPEFGVTALCNAVDTQGSVDTYWYTITNLEDADVEVTWDGGTAVIPAGESRVIPSHLATLTLMMGDETIAVQAASDVVCTRDVTVEKTLIGQPASPETYTVRISRLVGDTYVPETTFDLVPGTPVTVSLPSTMDPAGIDYKVEEIAKGTASTTVITPSELSLAGHLGDTVSVVVTNGYASVSLAKSADTDIVGPGGSITYTLVGTNTGGLTLDPVAVLDRLPADVEYVSASVAGDAGTCVLQQSARPQLVVCTMNGALAAGASTAAITLTVTVDADATSDADLTNQGKIVGNFAESSPTEEPAGAALSCEPVVAGQVCALSAEVNVTLTQSEPPTTTAPGSTTTTTPGATTTTVVSSPPLPRSGNDPRGILVVAFGLAAAGGALVLVRRRRPA